MTCLNSRLQKMDTNDEKRAKLDKLVQHSMAHSAAIQQMSVVYLGLNQYQYVVDTHGFETSRTDFADAGNPYA
jgi:hypothetical protein